MRVLLLAVWLAVAPLRAVPILSDHPLQVLAQAEALIVGRVVRIDKGREVHPPEGRQWPHPVFEHVAEVELLRSYAREEMLTEGLSGAASIRISYKAENPLGQGRLSGPLWPEIREGDVRLFAVKRADGGTLGLWLEEGFGAVPSIAARLLQTLPVADSLGFAQREFANMLASGEPTLVRGAAQYLSRALRPKFGSEPDSLPSLLGYLAQMLDNDARCTEEAAAALLAAQGTPRPTARDFVEGRLDEQDARHPFHRLIAWTLQQLPSEDQERRLIETLARNMAVDPWGAAMTLKNFAYNPALEAPLAAAIAERRPGILPTLEVLIREGRQDLIPDALAVLRDTLEASGRPEVDLQTGSRLLWKFGSAEDFGYLLALAARSREDDPQLYAKLWRAADYDPGPPSRPWLRLMAMYLADLRPAYDSLRYCDLALGALSRQQEDRFGLDRRPPLDEIPLAERDAAIERAARWLAQQLETAP